MAFPENMLYREIKPQDPIVAQDREIGQRLGSYGSRPNAASDLLEHYRISGEDRRYHFVAALIMRLCVLEARNRFGRQRA